MSFSKVSIAGSQANPDYVYYNATVVNNTVTTTLQGDDPPITFQDTRQNAIIKDSSQYDVAVANFSLNGATKTLPVFIPQIQPTVSSSIFVPATTGSATYGSTTVVNGTTALAVINTLSFTSSAGTGTKFIASAALPSGLFVGGRIAYTATTGALTTSTAYQVSGYDTTSSSVSINFGGVFATGTGTLTFYSDSVFTPTIQSLPVQNNSTAVPTSLKYFYTGSTPPVSVGGAVTITAATFPATSSVFPYTSQTPTSLMNVTSQTVTAVDTVGSSFSIAYSGNVLLTNSTYTLNYVSAATPNITASTSSVTYFNGGTTVSKGFYVSVTVSGANQYNTVNALVTSVTATTFTVANPFSVAGTSLLSYSYTYIDPTIVDNTVYSVTFAAFNGTASTSQTYVSSTQFIVWEPENQTTYTVKPLSAYPTQQLTNDYYYTYTYAHFVRLINKALFNAWTDVTSSTGYAASSAGTAINCPFVEFDETTGLFSISQDAQTTLCPIGSQLNPPFKVTAVTATAGLPTGAYSLVGMNSNLEGLISNWENIYYGAGKTFFGATVAKSYTNGTGAFATSTLASRSGVICPLPEVVISNGMSGFDTVAAGTVITYNPIGVGVKTKPVVSTYQLTNPFTAAAQGATSATMMVRMTETNISTGSLWSPCNSFVIGTVSIPVRMEEIANPVIIGQGNNGGESASAGSFQKVLLETPINAVTADLWRGWVLYQPLVPTYSSMDPVHDGISQLDFQLYWRNRLTNSLVPLRLYNTGTFNIRLLFRRKGIV